MRILQLVEHSRTCTTSRTSRTATTMAKSIIASQCADGKQQCAAAAEHEPERDHEDNNNCDLGNQSESAEGAVVVVWDDRCDEDEPMAQVLEAIRLALDKETKSRYIRDYDCMKETQRHGMKNAWRVKICRWMFEVCVCLVFLSSCCRWTRCALC